MPSSLTPNDDEDDEGEAVSVGTYEVCDIAKEVLIARFSNFLKDEKINPSSFDKKVAEQSFPGRQKEVDAQLAYPCGLGKFHKSPLGWRFIACSSKYSLRALSIWLSLAFKAMMPSVHELWSSKLSEVGIFTSKCWIAKDSSRVPELISNLNYQTPKAKRKDVTFRTFDFTQMYTNIDLASLKSQIAKLIDWVFALQLQSTSRCKFLRVFRLKKENQQNWTRNEEDDSSKLKCFTPGKLKRWFNFLVDNIFLQFSKTKF